MARLLEADMYIEIINDLIRWKDKARRKPLMVTGVRQCGKTYIIEELGKTKFAGYVYMNFETETALSAIFDYDFNVRRIITEIERHYKKR